ncbi:hypothetical protein ALI22I_30550 [Saccharothrix sp. ALI-22-I]|uniref:SMI1/KNR4 family protein n=1 Tax=Saccharothrix sp. ALI-22-I TaxID=1933778 RepID=UPI00097C14A0|nr:SMI1/KNR4 family protein [Saccharothrix sp. ALI-22-I]ONI84828.1 hypothetical protein ALI22I_30550 [Saccharothrix sp. ALI-22-I]
MHPLVARLDRWIRENRADYYAGLAPGASLETIDHLIGESVPPLLREMLAWRNGNDDEAFLDNRTYMSVQRIRQTMDDMTGMAAGGEFDLANWWCPDWVPFLAGAGGDNVCVDLGAAIGGQPGQVVEFRHDDSVRPITNASFEAWLGTYVEALEAGLLAEDEGENYSAADTDAYDALVTARNPGYPVYVDLSAEASVG